MIGLVGLAEKRDAQVKTLSGGQKRRLDLGVALVGDPELVFLDEPTTGFDPAARRNAWALIRSLRELGKTILLTTHYLDEAQQLADRVAVLRAGEIVRIGKPSELTASAGVADPLPAARRAGRARDGRADTRAARADRRARWPRDSSSRISSSAARRSRTSTSTWSERRTSEPLLASAAGRAADVFWRSREAAIFVFLFPPLLFVLLASVFGDGIEDGRRVSTISSPA